MRRHGVYYRLFYHFVWSTRSRLPILTPGIEADLFAFFGQKCQELDYRLHAVGGTEDHVHLLIELAPIHRIADVAKMLKGSSSHHINHSGKPGHTLYWQDGYGVVTLREDDSQIVKNYIPKQKVHHAHGRLSAKLERMDHPDS